MTGKDFLDTLCGSSTVEGLLDKNSDDTKFRTTALGWLNLVLKDITNRQANWHWRWLEKTATTTTVDGQHSYDVPGDLADANKIIAIYERTNDLTLRYIPYEDFVKLVPDPSEAEGNPTIWTLHANTIRLYPVPDSAITIYMDYVSTVTLLTDASDSNTEVPVKYDPVILDGALVYGYRFDPEMGNFANQFQIFEAGVQRMIQDNKNIIAEVARTQSHRTRGRDLNVLFPMDTHGDGTWSGS